MPERQNRQHQQEDWNTGEVRQLAPDKNFIGLELLSATLSDCLKSVSWWWEEASLVRVLITANFPPAVLTDLRSLYNKHYQLQLQLQLQSSIKLHFSISWIIAQIREAWRHSTLVRPYWSDLRIILSIEVNIYSAGNLFIILGQWETLGRLRYLATRNHYNK